MAVTRTRRRQWHPTPVLLPGKSHGLQSTSTGRQEPQNESYITLLFATDHPFFKIDLFILIGG